MCRWLAYSGPPILLEDLLVKPSHSLLVQSRYARENYIQDVDGLPDGSFPTNGDGFGIGWYGDLEEPGLYREEQPAWSDANLLNLSAHIRSGLFMAHLRAAYHGIVQRTNCHPFAYHNWMFQHNGETPGFEQIKRDLQYQVDPELFPLIQGTTDSETAFFLALTFGLRRDPKAALERMIGEIEQLRSDRGFDEPLRMTCAASDGERIYAIRYSSDRNSKTLYVSRGQYGAQEVLEDRAPSAPAQIILSEPLDDCDDRWRAVPESSFITVCEGELDVEDFRPAA